MIGMHVFGVEDERLEQVVGSMLRERNLTIAVAESCTGGLVGNRITNVPGSSEYFLGGVIAYSNELKRTLLGVREETLIHHGAVSPEVAQEMARGIRERTGAAMGISTTGIAGPGGGTPVKPVGLVYIGLSTASETYAEQHLFSGEREFIKLRSSQAALNAVRLHLLRSTETKKT
jgi:nicotinamide-nucleotide amidase